MSQFARMPRTRPPINISADSSAQSSVEDERQNTSDSKLRNSDEHDTSSDYTSSIVETQRKEFMIRRSKSASFGVGQKMYFQVKFFGFLPEKFARKISMA